MRVNFFEEFPNSISLSKAKLIDFPSTIFIAAKSFEEFKKWKEELEKINPNLESAYWPIIKRSYWLSSFSYHEDIQKLYDDLRKNTEKKRLKILFDLEVPFNLRLYKNVFHFRKNKKLIKTIFLESKELNIEIYTAEYPLSNRLIEKIFRFFGINYDMAKFPHKRIMMYYTNKLDKRFLRNMAEKTIDNEKKKYGDQLELALRSNAVGIFGETPNMSLDDFKRDFEFVKSKKIHTVTIFRLEGLSKEYLELIKKFV